MLLKDIPGLAEEKQHLLDSVHRGRNSHAQLFHGRSGTASFALALAYAQYLACENPREDDSCGLCSACKQFEKLSYPDLHFSFPFSRVAGAPRTLNCEYFQKDWINFISEHTIFELSDWLNNLDVSNKQAQINVDESARIIQKLTLKSYAGKSKFLIIYLPEYLHGSAANKLLKTLEEPSGDSLIILVSEDPEKLLQTITSRCQKLYIPRPKEKELVQYLESQGLSSVSAQSAASVSEGNIVHALKIAEDSERYLNYGQLFQNWMRGCYSAKVKEIFAFVDEFNALDKESQKEALRFFLQTLQIAFKAKTEATGPSHPIYERLSFKLAGFASVLHPKNAKMALEVLDKAIFDISRNGNVKIILSDASFKFSNLLRIKEEA